MNRFDFYFGQLVRQSDLDGAFDSAENADKAIMSDQGIVGIQAGLVVTQNATPNQTVQVSSGRGYDQQGQRILLPATETINLSVNEPPAGQQRWISIAIYFDRELSDQRTDDNNVTLQYNRAESFRLEQIAGPTASVDPTRPTKPADGLVLADILFANGGVIATANIDMDTNGRRDFAIEATATGPLNVKAGTVPEAIQAAVTNLNGHINGATGQHPATALTIDDATLVAQGYAAAANIQTAFNSIALEAANVNALETVSARWTFNNGINTHVLVPTTTTTDVGTTTSRFRNGFFNNVLSAPNHRITDQTTDEVLWLWYSEADDTLSLRDVTTNAGAGADILNVDGTRFRFFGRRIMVDDGITTGTAGTNVFNGATTFNNGAVTFSDAVDFNDPVDFTDSATFTGPSTINGPHSVRHPDFDGTALNLLVEEGAQQTSAYMATDTIVISGASPRATIKLFEAPTNPTHDYYVVISGQVIRTNSVLDLGVASPGATIEDFRAILGVRTSSNTNMGSIDIVAQSEFSIDATNDFDGAGDIHTSTPLTLNHTSARVTNLFVNFNTVAGQERTVIVRWNTISFRVNQP